MDQLFNLAITHDAQWINVCTWNDYLEGHQFAPSINHNFAHGPLMHYNASKWRGKEPSAKEFAVCFFKKYPIGTKPTSFDYPILHKDLEPYPDEEEDGIHVITYLKQPATLTSNGTTIQAKPGFHIHTFPMKEGAVTINLTRGNKAFITMSPHEWITYSPYRTDRFTYMFSSEYEAYAKKIFGTSNLPRSEEYVVKPK